jgi:hypothetical protein
MIVGLLDDDLMVRNNIGDVAHCERSLQTLNEDSGDQLYRYYRLALWPEYFILYGPNISYT